MTVNQILREKDACPLRSNLGLLLPCLRFGDLVTHFQVKRWLHGQPMQEASEVMTEIMAGEGAIQSANSVS